MKLFRRPLFLAFLVGVMVLGAAWFLMTSRGNPLFQKSSAYCFLAGTAKNNFNAGEQAQGFESLTSMIRIRIEADELPLCRDLAEQYCKKEILRKNHAPENLVLTYRVEGERIKSHRFLLDADCVARETGTEVENRP